ncbi:hypothetical protein V494_03926 [Pseudogymnoascus sp. VKM F-4513 (FW-928)]|nr:hypothetical protein V494_03926 [Pseudogymnoascus sp. VKM F-4513 (FW-928)]
MPLGFERINARRQQPNEYINFIKPLDGPDKEFSEDFLQRIAAICKPIMRSNHLTVMSLEEHKCNPEFLGRNFNAGEVIQLVLKAPSGHWLPFKFVQMVMMHELAHCKQMNHSKSFWKVKDQYSAELKTLWQKGYTGDGMWSRGRTLLTGQYDQASLGSEETLPEHLCGGTFRSSGKRKRAAKPKLSYKERKERTIAKKFGVNGVALGADEETKAKLEKGKKTASNPRVAGSNRGRELRAMAALSRFTPTTENNDKAKADSELTQSGGSETESDWEADLSDGEEVVDSDGKKLQDGKGRTLIRVCDDEDPDEINVKDEMSELRKFGVPEDSKKPSKSMVPVRIEAENKSSMSQSEANEGTHRSPNLTQERRMVPSSEVSTETASGIPACPVCSVENNVGSPTCMVCANVLDPKKILDVWKCKSDVCRGGRGREYTNAGDYGVCGLCGEKPRDSTKTRAVRAKVYFPEVL